MKLAKKFFYPDIKILFVRAVKNDLADLAQRPKMRNVCVHAAYFQWRVQQFQEFSDAILVLLATDRLDEFSRIFGPHQLLDAVLTTKLRIFVLWILRPIIFDAAPRDDGDKVFGLPERTKPCKVFHVRFLCAVVHIETYLRYMNI